ncbi:MAG TPA: selenobiotic family radical SAM modification target peptide [Desulfobulbus sp.]|nr:selenobiotic family radical SAM modification target peptide [Desulfobulbus sp.]
MISKDVKKFLAGLGVAGLISTGGISVTGAHAAASG